MQFDSRKNFSRIHLPETDESLCRRSHRRCRVVVAQSTMDLLLVCVYILDTYASWAYGNTVWKKEKDKGDSTGHKFSRKPARSRGKLLWALRHSNLRWERGYTTHFFFLFLSLFYILFSVFFDHIKRAKGALASQRWEIWIVIPGKSCSWDRGRCIIDIHLWTSDEYNKPPFGSDRSKTKRMSKRRDTRARVVGVSLLIYDVLIAQLI